MADEIATRLALRRELINQVALSTGSVKTAEYVVNRLTVHNTDLLARAALAFASEHLGPVGALPGKAEQ